MSAWTDEEREEVYNLYLAENPTAENSVEICAKIAEKTGRTVNGIRIILVKKGIYVKQEQATNTKKSGGNGGGSTRVSKADAQESLREQITEIGAEVDDEIIEKLTGKACVYLVEVLKAANA